MSTKDLEPKPTLEPTPQDDTGPLPPPLPEVSTDLPAPTWDEEPATAEVRAPLPDEDDVTEVEPPPPAPSPLGGDLSAAMAAQDEDEAEETLMAGTAEAAAMRAQALLRSLPAPPHATGNQPLKTKEEVEASKPKPFFEDIEPPDTEPQPPSPQEPAEVVAGTAPMSLRALLMVSAAWNIISGIMWAIGLVTIPLAIFCWILAFFEARLALQAGDLDQKTAAERAIKVSYWEMGALVYALAPFTFCFGVAIQIYARKLAKDY